jgi:hypothetical protein
MDVYGDGAVGIAPRPLGGEEGRGGGGPSINGMAWLEKEKR